MFTRTISGLSFWKVWASECSRDLSEPGAVFLSFLR